MKTAFVLMVAGWLVWSAVGFAGLSLIVLSIAIYTAWAEVAGL